MDVGEIISNDISEYRIDKVLYRTKGSIDQVLSEDKNIKNKEHRRTFYIAYPTKNCIKVFPKYFIKEYTDSSLGKSIFLELERTRKCCKRVKIGYDSVVSVIGCWCNDKIIVFPYLDNHLNLKDYLTINPEKKEIVKALLTKWFLCVNIDNYDLSYNNVLVADTDNNKLEMTLIDFEYSPDKGKNQWKQFIDKI